MKKYTQAGANSAVAALLLGLGLFSFAQLTDPVPALSQRVHAPIRPATIVSNAAPALRPVLEGGSEFSASVRSSGPLVRPERLSVPIGLSIPAIAVEGPVSPVGLAPDAVLNVPEPNTGGWYEHSAAPGERGATVVAAHADLNGETALFFDLRNLAPGDEVVVVMSNGALVRYSVETVTLYDKRELAQAALFRQHGDHVLHLITCGGDFDAQSRSYRGNTVVVATPVLA